MPQVSWIIPILNGMPYLPEALASLEAQTYRDFEVLVWDNGSTDGTLDVVRQWIPSRLPGRVITGEPQSLGNSLRRLGEIARTPLLARMDADDICEPDRLAVQCSFMAGHPEVALVASERICVDESGRETEPRSSYPLTSPDILHATLRAPRIVHPTVMMRRSALLEVGNYRDLSSSETPYWSEDYDLWLRFLAVHHAVALPDKLLRYRYNPRGLTENEMRLKRAAKARRAAWQANAAAFAGIADTGTAMRLWDRQLCFSLPVLHAIARHFAKKDGISPSRRWGMSSFQKAASSFVRRQDLATRIWLKLAAVRSHRA
jgi:glycosyltransferase involved in cell wall biosynthesis